MAVAPRSTERCTCPSTVADGDVQIITRDGLRFTIRQSYAYIDAHALGDMLGADSSKHDGTTVISTANIATLCIGRLVRAVTLHAAPRWAGRSQTFMVRARLCSGHGTVGDIHEGAAVVRSVGSIRLHLRASTVELSGTSDAQRHVLFADMPALPSLDFAVSHVSLGSAIEAVGLYTGGRYEGRELIVEHGSIDGGRDALTGDTMLKLRRPWCDTVHSLTIIRPCNASNVMCGARAAAIGAPARERRRLMSESTAPPEGELLPYRTPKTDSPVGFPPRLANGARGTFHAYNPFLLIEADGSASLLARWSNYNFCTHKKNFDANLAEAKGALTSVVVRVPLNTTSWDIAHGGRLAVWDAITARHPMDESEIVSGAEDPRAIRWRGETLVFVAAWESSRGDGLQWQHMLRLPLLAASIPGQRASDTRMEIDERASPRLGKHLPTLATPRAQRTREKNWNPFVWKDRLYVEYSLEPRLVLMVDRASGRGAPVLPMTSSPAVQAWVEKLGPVSGGTPAVELPGHGVFLALGHVKLFKKKGSRTATSKMMYKHFWYAFEARPPFAILGASLPFTLPSQLPSVPSIQFATGLVYQSRTRELIVSYGELDCYATLARFPLTATLEATLGRRKSDTPPHALD